MACSPSKGIVTAFVANVVFIAAGNPGGNKKKKKSSTYSFNNRVQGQKWVLHRA